MIVLFIGYILLQQIATLLYTLLLLLYPNLL